MPTGTGYTLPYLTGEMPGIAGKIRARWEDFIVEEVPLYQPAGKGNHLFVQIEKKGMATMDLIVQIARNLNIPRHKIGYAGLKDARAVTRQWLSIENIKPEQLQTLHFPRFKILQNIPHENKLKIGHLAGNRFIIRVRDIDLPIPEAVNRTEQIMAQLTSYGVPNYFGPQRFGRRMDSHLIGDAIIRNQKDRFIDLFLGLPDPVDQSVIFVARSYYEQGDFQNAYNSWPHPFHDQRRVLHALIRGKTRYPTMADLTFEYLSPPIPDKLNPAVARISAGSIIRL